MDFRKFLLALCVMVPVLSSCEKEPSKSEKDVCGAITDKAFKNQVYTLFDTNHDGIITKTEAEAATDISITDSRVTSVAGIEAFSKIKSLTIKGASISSVDLSKNTSLVTVVIADCTYLTSVSFGNVTTIEDLTVTGTKISSLDVSKMAELKSLDCSKNSLTSLDVKKNVNLVSLKCSLNNIKILDISKNILLKTLDCYMPTLTEMIINKEHLNAEFIDSILAMEGVKLTIE